MHNRNVRLAVLAALSSAGALCSYSAVAGDIGFDGTLPGTVGGKLDKLNQTYAITQDRGLLSGSNLFHSFDVFKLDTGETAVFSGNAGIANVISRVTGGMPTTIDGTVRSTINGANFFFVNPAGLTLGPNGAIDVSGAVALGAADAIVFDDELVFSANPAAPAVGFSMANPVAFGFLGPSDAGQLVIQGSNLLNAGAPSALLLTGASGVTLTSDQDIRLTNARITTASSGIAIRSAGAVTLEGSQLNTTTAVTRGTTLGGPASGITILGEGQVTLRNVNTGGVLASSQPVSITGAGVELQDSELTVFTQVSPDFPRRGTVSLTATGTFDASNPGAGVVNVVRSTLSANNGETGADGGVGDGSPADLVLTGDFVRLADSTLMTSGRGNVFGDDILINGLQGVAILGVDTRSQLMVQTLFAPPSAGRIAISGGAAGTTITRSDIVSRSVATAGSPEQRTGGIAISSDGGAVNLTDAVVRTRAVRALQAANGVADVGSDITLEGASVHIRGGELSTSVDFEPLLTSPQAPDAGNISITALGGDLVVDGAARIRSDTVTGGAELQNGVVSSASDAGRIDLQALGGTVRILDGSVLETSAGENAGAAGAISIAGADIQLDGATVRTVTRSSLVPAVAIDPRDLFDPPPPPVIVEPDPADPDPIDPVEPQPVGNGFAPASIKLAASGAVAINNSDLNASTSGSIQAGVIFVDASSIQITADSPGGTSLATASTGTAAAGGVRVVASDALRVDNTQVTASAGVSSQDGGLIRLRGGSAQVSNSRIDSTNASGVTVAPAPFDFAVSTASDITVETTVGDLTIQNTQITTQTTGTGPAGNIGVGSDDGLVRISNSEISASTTASGERPDVLVTGNAGDVRVSSGSRDPNAVALRIEGTRISSSAIATEGASSLVGNAGGVLITAENSQVEVASSTLESSSSGAQAGFSGTLFVGAASLEVEDSQLSVSVESQRADLLEVRPPTTFANLFLEVQDLAVDDSTITATSSGVLSAGAIAVFGSRDGEGRIELNNSSLRASATGTGGAGFVLVAGAANLQLNHSLVESSSEGLLGGPAGAAVLGADNIVLNGSTVRTASASRVFDASGQTGINLGLNVSIEADESLTLIDSALEATTTGVIDGGDIFVTTPQLRVTGSTISTTSLGGLASGPADMTDTPVLSGSFTPGSGGGVSIELIPFEPAGDFEMTSSLTGYAQISNSTITANAVAASGGGIGLRLNGNELTLRDSSLVASAGASGSGGGIFIADAGSASIQGTDVLALADSGVGGTISISLAEDAAGMVSIDGSRIATNATNATGGSIELNAVLNRLQVRDSSIVASAGGAGMGGDIVIGAGDISLQGTQVQALADAGTGGTIGVRLAAGTNGALTLDNSAITTNAMSGNGGSIEVDAAAQQVSLRGSSIVASAGGSGMGGSISLNDTAGTTLIDSEIQALAKAGAGGTISIGVVAGTGGLTLDNSSITTNAANANAGSIALDAGGGQFSALRGSSIVASAGGTGTGGDVSIMNAGAVQLRDSQVQALADAGSGGTITLTIAGDLDDPRGGPLSLDNSTISTIATSANGGNIVLDAAGREVVLRNSNIVASAGGAGIGGSISILEAGRTSVQTTQIQALAQSGRGGTINLELTRDQGALSIDGSSIRANAAAANGGSIAIDAAGNPVQLRDTSIVASAGGSGIGGDISIANAGVVTLQNSQVQALANAGAGGTIGITQADGLNGSLSIEGSSITTNATNAAGGSITLDAAGNQFVLRNSNIVASAGGTGTGGDISIMNAGGATLIDSQVQALANAGAGGTISIDLADGSSAVLIDGSSITTNAANADGGNISLDAGGHQLVLRGASIVASAGGSGAGGDISILDAGGATLQDTQIQALANAGAGGTITLALRETAAGAVVLQRSSITTNAEAASGGNITLTAAGNPLILRDSTIRASAGAAGTGGNVLIDDAGLTVIQRSQVLARADAGNGGTVTINLAPGALFLRDAQSVISADSNSGNDGAVDINSPDTDLNPAVQPQDASLVGTPELSANVCDGGAAAPRSTFVSEARGGVSASPDSYLATADLPRTPAQKTASTATEQALRLAMLDAKVPATEGCR